MHSKSPLVIAFCLVCLGILAKNMPKRLAGYYLLNSYQIFNFPISIQLFILVYRTPSCQEKSMSVPFNFPYEQQIKYNCPDETGQSTFNHRFLLLQYLLRMFPVLHMYRSLPLPLLYLSLPQFSPHSHSAVLSQYFPVRFLSFAL